MKHCILLVDDDPDFAQTQQDILEFNGYRVETAFSIDDAKNKLESFEVNVALLDIRLGEASGLELIPEIQSRYPKSLCVMSTAVVSSDTVIVALQKGAYDYLCKPYYPEDLLATMERCFERIRLEDEKIKAEEALKWRIWKNEELEKINQRLKRMVESMQGLAHCTTIRELCPLVLEQFAHNMAANGGSVYLYEKNQLVLKHSLDSGHAPAVIPLPLKAFSVFGQVMQSKQPQLIAELEKQGELLPSGWTGYGSTSLLAFPLLGETNEVIGVLSLHEKKGPHFTEQDKELGLILIAYISEAIRAVKALEDFQSSEEQVRLLLNSTGEGIFGVDRSGICTFVNTSCLRMLGYRHEQDLMGKNMHEIIHRNNLDQCVLSEGNCEVYKAYLEGKENHLPSGVFSHSEGQQFAVESWSHPVSKNQQVIGSVVTFVDITQRKKIEDELNTYRLNLEEKVKQRTAELSQLNEELSAFAHSISHDLKAPLRAIEGFSDILLEDYSQQLDQQGNEFLDEIRQGSIRMAHLIDDLLTHARLSEKFSLLTTVNLSALIERVLKSLASDIADADAHINIVGNLPEITGHLATLEILMQNLISNSIKFVAPAKKPKILISAEETPSEYCITVSDNGIGIDTIYHDNIFNIFERLHSEDEYPGTGIGLAIAKKVVTLHKGSIWLDSNADSGTQFHFTISKSLSGQALM